MKNERSGFYSFGQSRAQPRFSLRERCSSPRVGAFRVPAKSSFSNSVKTTSPRSCDGQQRPVAGISLQQTTQWEEVVSSTDGYSALKMLPFGDCAALAMGLLRAAWQKGLEFDYCILPLYHYHSTCIYIILHFVIDLHDEEMEEYEISRFYVVPSLLSTILIMYPLTLFHLFCSLVHPASISYISRHR